MQKQTKIYFACKLIVQEKYYVFLCFFLSNIFCLIIDPDFVSFSRQSWEKIMNFNNKHLWTTEATGGKQYNR